jgi:hypothetical protein
MQEARPGAAPPQTSDRGTPRRRLGPAALDLLTLGLAAGLAFTQAMVEVLSHDEHQFVAAGWLLGEEGLLPYRDFPFHHLPNLALLYAVLGRLTPALLLNARLLSAAFGLGTAVLLYAYARRSLRGLGIWAEWALASCAVLALVLSPLFRYTSGRAWNHALPSLLSLAALWFHLAAGRSERPGRWLASGLLLGAAVGARASFLALLVPFGWFAYRSEGLAGGTGRRGLLYSLAGTFVGLAPALLFAAIAPRHFVYGNFIYPLQNAQYRRLLQHDDAMTLPSKLGYFSEEVLLDPPHLLLAAAGIGLAWRALRGRPREREPGPARNETWLAAASSAALLVGGLIPTPSWYQYFYAPLPFALLALVTSLPRALPSPRAALASAGLFAGALVIMRAGSLGELGLLARPDDWEPLRVHRLGQAVRAQVGGGPILTVAPIVPLEGGLEIYPAFATGSLTWRVSPFMAAAARQEYGVIAPADLAAYLEAEPPSAILTGFEFDNEGFSLDDPGGLELPVEEYAREHGYRRTVLECGLCARRRLKVWQPAVEAEPGT